MKYTLVHGINSLNVGDDLFLIILKKRYPKAQFVIYAPEKYKQILGDGWVVVSDSDFIGKVISVLSKFLHLPKTAIIYAWLIIRYRVNLFIIIGGSLFMEGKSRIPSLLRGINFMRKIRPKIKVAIVGSNFGPCITSQWKKQVEKSLYLVNDVCFRDKPSYEEFSHLLNVRWGNDIVMHMKNVNFNLKKDRGICVNIRSVEKWPTLKPYKSKYLQKVKTIINYFQQNNYSIRLLSFCKSYGDNEITEELYNILDNKNGIEMYFYDGDLDKILTVISSSEYMVGTRFHAIVLGLVYKLKVLPISYSIKTENMLKTYNIWRDLYDFNQFCECESEILLNNFIEDFEINVNYNTMFDYTDQIIDQ